MPKRFIATELWSEDWFLEMPTEYKLFWYYMISKCDHSGLFKPNLRSFCVLNEVKLSSKDILDYFNNGKTRIRIISESTWLIEDFFVFQYGNNFNPKNRVHESIGTQYLKNDIKLTTIRGLIDLTDRVKDKDIDKDKDKEWYSNKKLNEIFEKFLKNQKKGLTDDRIDLWIKRLSEFPNDTQRIKTIEKSIRGGYSDFYDLVEGELTDIIRKGVEYNEEKTKVLMDDGGWEDLTEGEKMMAKTDEYHLATQIIRK